MQATWIIVGHRAGARIFERDGKDLVLVREFDHEAGRLKDGDLNSDRPGFAFDSTGAGRRAMATEESPHERVANAFARDLAEALRAGRNEQRFDRLILVAEPRFLGMLRQALDAPTAALVEGTVNKDLARVTARDLPGHLGEVMPALLH